LVNPSVSIIVPCREVSDYTRECIERCLDLDYHDFEILVLPDSTTELNLSKVKVLATGSVGPSEKRDLALNASGKIIAFIDDDAYPSKSWLRKAVKHFQDENIAAVGGPAVTPPEESVASKAGGFVLATWLGSGSLRYRYTPLKQREVDDYPSCNLIIRKSVFQELGGFQTRFWPGEDTKLCLDIVYKLQKKIIYDPDVLVYHHRRELLGPHLKQIWNYGVHRGYFVKKFPRTSLRLSYFIPSLFVLGLILGIAASFFSPVLSVVFMAVLAIYLLLVLISSFVREVKLIPLVYLGIISTHLTYGVGFVKGLLTWGSTVEN